MSRRNDRINQLKSTVTEYVTKEQTRISNEVAVLEKILSGRTGGRGIQAISTKAVTAVANADLTNYLAGV
jgi:hypothetical protein